MYPGSKTNTNLGNKTNDNAYPGKRTNDSTYPGKRTNDSTYPGNNINDNAYPGNKTNDNSYTGRTTNQPNNENQMQHDDNGRPVNPPHRPDVDNDYANVMINNKDKQHRDPKLQGTSLISTNPSGNPHGDQHPT